MEDKGIVIGMQTINCVRCGKLATQWTGHVIKPNGVEVFAGWCDKCVDCRGFSGRWSEDMGEQPDVVYDDTVFKKTPYGKMMSGRRP